MKIKKRQLFHSFTVLLMLVAMFVQIPLHAGRYYVGFSSSPSGATAKYNGDNKGLTDALAAAGADDTVFIAKGLKFYLDAELFIDEHVVGGCNPSGDGLLLANRMAIGAAESITDSMTVLDGNSLRTTLRSEKHRVATVNTGGCIENCLIRNGHARGWTNTVGDTSGYGGGVLLNGGKLYNCIIRGNVAMNVEYKSSNPSKGGGLYIISGQAVNCIISFNMDDAGAGVGGNSGKLINCTVARNSNTPTYVRMESGVYQPFNGVSTANQIPNKYVYLDAFYIASTETTGGQYSCFMAAIDYDGTSRPYLTCADADSIKSAKMPTEVSYSGYPEGITVADYTVLAASSTIKCDTSCPSSTCWILIEKSANLLYGGSLTSSDNVVLYTKTDTNTIGTYTAAGEAFERDNYAMSLVSWYGGLAFSLWLGGSLPTEAQWEYAARQKSDGTTDSVYYYAGATVNDAATGLSLVGWYQDNSILNSSRKGIHEVGKKNPTGKGLHDMSGNVCEWCVDQYIGSIYFANMADSVGDAGGLTVPEARGKNLVSADKSNNGGSADYPLRNPIVYPSSGMYRVFRGGNWNESSTLCTLGYRLYNTPSITNTVIGFRSVLCP